MTAPPVIEIRESGRAARRLTVDRAIEVGRDRQGAVLVGTTVSFAYLKLMASPVALSIVNLGDSGAAFVNGRTIDGRAILGTSDIIRFGTAEIEVCPAPP